MATIAELAGASERQVQRVLRVFEREHYINRVDQGRRPDRPRKGEEPGQARPSTWCLRPDQWQQRPLRHRTGVVAISSDQQISLPVLGKLVRKELSVAATTLGLADVKALHRKLASSTLTAVAQKHNVQATLPSPPRSRRTSMPRFQARVAAGTLKSDRAATLKLKAETKVDAFMTRQFKSARE
ncbi:MAG: hypothetical protein ACR2IK_06420 [Chloroflexota bacterium]